MPRSRSEREARRAAVEDLGRRQGNVVGLRQALGLGLTWSEVRAAVQSGRWTREGRCLQVGIPDSSTWHWRAVLEVGPAAVLDGVSALVAAGLRLPSGGPTSAQPTVHVAVPPRSWFRRCQGVRVHETRMFREEDVLRVGLPRTRPATAAVHAAVWARSDEQAALFVIAAVQQRLVRVADLDAAVARLTRDKRRPLLLGLLADVRGGVESLGELAFARQCRRRGFPEPDRQVAVRLPSGRVRYDNVWDRYGLTVEIHGAQHLDVAMASRDMLKQNAAAMGGHVTLQVPNFRVRVNPDPFLDQMEVVFRAGGWDPPHRLGNRAS